MSGVEKYGFVSLFQLKALSLSLIFFFFFANAREQGNTTLQSTGKEGMNDCFVIYMSYVMFQAATFSFKLQEAGAASVNLL